MGLNPDRFPIIPLRLSIGIIGIWKSPISNCMYSIWTESEVLGSMEGAPHEEVTLKEQLSPTDKLLITTDFWSPIALKLKLVTDPHLLGLIGHKNLA